jgi:hypothetical protein
MTITRSQAKKMPLPYPLNTKGYPTVGMLTVKSYQKSIINPYISRCDSLEETAIIYDEIMTKIAYDNKKYNRNYYQWSIEIYRKLFDYIDRSMIPTFEEIDAMLLICSILLKNNKKNEIAEFILNCPEQFLMTYANNSEHSPMVFNKLHNLGLDNICNYLMSYVHYTKLTTWNERENSHLKNKINFEYKFL